MATHAPAAGSGRGVLVASGLFGVYHLAHSPPFNVPSMALFLSVVGLATGAVFFLGRDVWGTMVFHNLLALTGVLGALAAEGRPGDYETLRPSALLAAAAALVVLGGIHVGLARR